MKRTFGIKTGLLVVSFMALMLCTNLAYRVSAQSEALNSNSDRQVSTSNSIAQLNEEAAILYRQALENNIEEVRGSILRISKSLEHISFEGQTTVEGIHALSETIVEVKQAVVKVKNDDASLQQSSAKLRLAADSLANPTKPLWLQYYKIVKNDLDALSAATNQGQTAAVLANRYTVLEEHYETIRPAALIRREPYEIAQMDAWLSHTKGLTAAKQPDLAQLKSMVGHGEELVNQLFGREKDESAFVPFVQGPDRRAAGLLISSVIVATLSYAGYRKYRAQQQGIFPFRR
ncbi:sporulation protein YpjB [Paenibacillus xylanexedens]|uniref:sporulation protein YpjB n=1 Tax=Paenibacillus xylanexedens TaxID=528191 RepID=UPI00209CAA23|nr:sporulation protein YpjB [Paenibacillus xylanexedens]MCP1421678.1 sporulation protein YpjB [Paenibacillus xylanexedens]